MTQYRTMQPHMPFPVFRRIVALALIPLCLTVALRADMIILKDGREYEGHLIKAGAKEIVFQQGAEKKRYARGDIVHIRLQKSREWDSAMTAADIDDPVLKRCLAETPDVTRFPGAGIFTHYSRVTVKLRTPQLWSVERRSVIRILNEPGEGSSIRQIYFRKDVEQATIRHAISIRADGSLVHLRDTAVQDEAVYADSPRYNTVRRRRFAMPEGKPGTVLDVATVLTRNTALPCMWFADDFNFGDTDPAGELVVEIIVPQSVRLRWAMLNDPNAVVKYSKTTVAGGVRHRWIRADAPQLHPEPLMPPLADVVPRLSVSAYPGDWKAAAAEFQQILNGLDTTFADLPAPPTQDVDALWGQVSRKVQSINVSQLAAGCIPGDPSTTWKLRRGSGLDRVYLLYRWLRASGRKDVEWIWIRPRADGRLATNAPALTSFRVPALRLPGHTPAILIPGDDLSHISEPAIALGGGAILDSRNGVGRLPVAPATSRGATHTITVALERNGDARVSDTIRYRGSSARPLRNWRGLTAAEIRNAVAAQARQVDARATNIRYRVGDVTVNSAEIELTLDYDIPRFADVRPKLCSLRPPWLDYEARIVGRATRVFPLFWNTPRSDTVSVSIAAPARYELFNAPANGAYDAGMAQLVMAGKKTATAFQYSINYTRPKLTASVQDYQRLKQCLELRADIGRQYWVWRRDGK